MRLLAALLVFLAPAGAGAGREGLDLLAAGDAAAAEARFRDALDALPAAEVESPAGGIVRASAWVGLGLARYRQQDHAGAAEAFDEAARWTSDDAVTALALFDAGTALARAGRWHAARRRLERALLLRPDFADARHNLEVVLRRQPQTPPAGGRPPEPSAFARRVRARADSLVALRRYGEALDVFNEGLARDSTVGAFSDVIRRLEAVVGIVDADTAVAGTP